MSCNHTWCSPAVKTPQTWTIPIFKRSRIDSNSPTAIGEILQNPEPFASPQQSIRADLCTPKKIPKIGTPYRLAAISPAASWTQCGSSGTKHPFCVLCGVVLCCRGRSQTNIHPHLCELNRGFAGDCASACTLFWWNGGQDVWFSRCGDHTLGSLLLHPVVSQWSLM